MKNKRVCITGCQSLYSPVRACRYCEMESAEKQPGLNARNHIIKTIEQVRNEIRNTFSCFFLVEFCGDSLILLIVLNRNGVSL